MFRSAIERWRLEDPSLEGRSREVQGWAPGRASSGFHLRHTQRVSVMGPKRAGEAVVAEFETLFFVFFLLMRLVSFHVGCERGTRSIDELGLETAKTVLPPSGLSRWGTTGTGMIPLWNELRTYLSRLHLLLMSVVNAFSSFT